jgi:hypothetical protein
LRTDVVRADSASPDNAAPPLSGSRRHASVEMFGPIAED